jgi:hypothetical protein
MLVRADAATRVGAAVAIEGLDGDSRPVSDP